MNFERVLKELLDIFEQEKIRNALIGGFALGALGIPRMTLDLDFLIHRDDLEHLHGRLTSLGYVCRYNSDNVSQYQNTNQEWGAVDFLHAFRPLALKMLDRAASKPVLGGTRTVRVLQPEDIIGLKVQAMANDSNRKSKETADIEMLAIACRDKMDWSRLEEYYALFNLRQDFLALKTRVDHAE